MKNNSMFLGFGFLIVIIFMALSMFTVFETESALVLRLGKLREDNAGAESVLKPGLHFKWPLIESVRYIDSRLQTLEVHKSRIVTEEKKDVIVDSFVKWRVNDAPLFFKRTGANKHQAELLLRQKVFDGLRAEFGRHTIKEVVSGERLKIMELIRDKANESAAMLGIAVVDARIKSIDLPAEVSEAVFDRMRTERERIAAEHRAYGKEKAEGMRADADATVTVILAEAAAKAQVIRGEGDALAAKIYADSYAKDPEFYRFYKSLESYKQSFQNDNSFLVLKPESEFFNYMKNPYGKASK